MASCPFCNETYEDYRIVGVLPANEHMTDWLDPVPVAELFCKACGRYTMMHPDHPDVLRMHRAPPIEKAAENIRTLNVQVEEIGDPEVRQQFVHGEADR